MIKGEIDITKTSLFQEGRKEGRKEGVLKAGSWEEISNFLNSDGDFSSKKK